MFWRNLFRRDGRGRDCRRLDGRRIVAEAGCLRNGRRRDRRLHGAGDGKGGVVPVLFVVEIVFDGRFGCGGDEDRIVVFFLNRCD